MQYIPTAESLEPRFPRPTSSRRFISPFELLRSVYRRKWLVISIIGVVALTSAIVVKNLRPRYTSTSQVLIDTGQFNIVNIKAVLSDGAHDDRALQTEIDVLKSPSLAEQVIDAVALANYEEFRGVATAGTTNGLLDRLKSYLPEEWMASASDGTQSDLETAELTEARVRQGIIQRFERALEIEARDKSRVIRISFTSEDRALSAKVANAIAETYIGNQVRTKDDATGRASGWLNQRLPELRREVEASENAVAEFRSKSGLTQSAGSTITAQQAAELNQKLIVARVEQGGADARLNQAQALLGSSLGASAAGEVLNSLLIQNLRKEEITLAGRAADASTRLGPEHPDRRKAEAELIEVRARIREEVEKIVQALTGEARIARARVASLEQNLKRAQQGLNNLNEAEVKLKALEREASANRGLFETFLLRFKETSDQKGLDQADARILALAKMPTAPSFPRKKLIVALAVVTAGLLAVALAVLLEHTDRGLRNPAQIEELVGVRSIGLVPALPRLGFRTVEPQNYLIEKPASPYVEAIRALYAELHLADPGGKNKLILVTSAVPSEGKTGLVTSVARYSAGLGKRVLVIDCDFRRPRVHQAFGERNQVGMLNYVSGNLVIDEIIYKDSGSTVEFIPAGKAATDPAGALHSQRFREILEYLRRRYDLLLIDSPPVLAVADAKLMASMVDRVVVVAKWGATKIDTASEAVRQLTDAGASSVGIVLCQVDLRRHRAYGSNYGGYYYG